ncbi:dihydroxyacetone kinase family protein [Promicromonospora sukumoe]|uniref:dihydroxyacetone kinase family protein n=1 Tax=Promicromonospora sukumoe TaxID=88382 RepID=UPI00036D5236|nr:dihydroxyacetone kinase family protein [Promicromonospora sukumoe]
MTRLWNEPADFADEMLDGFVAAHPRHVRRVDGGVVRRAPAPEGQVAVVVGGGSGHYPAFGGLVGTGLAHGAAVGNLFASPSAQQVHAVAGAAHRGGGVLLTYGNYAGDVLNFDAAQERLRAEGVACETVVVTDDVASAPADERHRRRGVAGDLVVFRIAAAAAEAGRDLAGVAALARRANDLTRSFGVAFSGCRLPGAPEPLFTVPDGRMAVGLGIHGEPGIDERETPSADDLAHQLVDRLLAERPADAGSRVVPVLNGLGSVKYEEMFVVYRTVARLLAESGHETLDPHVGEFCTSFDMAGLSLTLFWPDADLEPLWGTPVDAPGYKRGTAAPQEAAPEVPQDGVPAGSATAFPASDAPSREVAAVVVDALRAVVTTIDEHAAELGRLDAVAGDGDHGIGMQRGAHAAADAAAAALAAGAGSRTVLAGAADAWSNRAGGTSGALWGLILHALAARLGDTGRPEPQGVAAGAAAALEDVMTYGKARPGDKTLVDALAAFSAELSRGVGAGDALVPVWHAAAEATVAAAAATADLVPRAGRARTHAERALGTPDPGARSLALVVTAVGTTLAAATGRS